MNAEHTCASHAQRTDKISVKHIDDDGTSEFASFLTAAHHAHGLLMHGMSMCCPMCYASVGIDVLRR